AETPAGVIEMMRIKGLGPKKLAIIWKEMGIESLGELEYACHENRLARQKGFGLKTQENVLSAIQFLRTNQGWFLWSTAELYAQNWLVQLKNLFSNGRF